MTKKLSKIKEKMSNSNFYIVGKHPVIEALKNPNRKIIKQPIIIAIEVFKFIVVKY